MDFLIPAVFLFSYGVIVLAILFAVLAVAALLLTFRRILLPLRIVAGLNVVAAFANVILVGPLMRPRDLSPTSKPMTEAIIFLLLTLGCAGALFFRDRTRDRAQTS